MKYYIIAGEASGDLHASHLMAELRQRDPQASFRGIGGDLMKAEGLNPLCHYKHLAYMGFLTVLLHLGTILRAMRHCQEDLMQWRPDKVILVDYAGFNLRIAKFVKQQLHVPIYYYIPPKLWAWKENRIKALRNYVDHILCILPFEVDYYKQRHHLDVHYVGNPSVEEIAAVASSAPAERQFIALLPGSRKQEISANLPRMIQAVAPYAQRYPIVLAAAPGFTDDYYRQWTGEVPVRIVHKQTFDLLRHSVAALVTSGTATLETALLDVPQVVCYYLWWGWMLLWAKQWILNAPYISLVNLIAQRNVVPELIAYQANARTIQRRLEGILPGGKDREAQLNGYRLVRQQLGTAHAAEQAANHIIHP